LGPLAEDAYLDGKHLQFADAVADSETNLGSKQMKNFILTFRTLVCGILRQIIDIYRHFIVVNTNHAEKRQVKVPGVKGLHTFIVATKCSTRGTQMLCDQKQ
jgi:hypothetical protein